MMLLYLINILWLVGGVMVWLLLRLLLRRLCGQWMKWRRLKNLRMIVAPADKPMKLCRYCKHNRAGKFCASCGQRQAQASLQWGAFEPDALRRVADDAVHRTYTVGKYWTTIE